MGNNSISPFEEEETKFCFITNLKGDRILYSEYFDEILPTSTKIDPFKDLKISTSNIYLKNQLQELRKSQKELKNLLILNEKLKDEEGWNQNKNDQNTDSDE